MSSKIEVSRDLLALYLSGYGGDWVEAGHELRALLAAPVVERQPVAIVTGSSVQWLPGAGSVKDRAELYTAPPELAECKPIRNASEVAYNLQAELAELQSTNKRLTETIQHMIDQTIPLVPDEKNPMWERRITIDELQATIARLTAENERLKGGQGEPALFVAVESIEDPECVGMHATRNANELQCVALFTSQPAPVSVVLPERFHEIMGFLDGSGTLDGWSFGSDHSSGRKFWWRTELRSCLDKVKELNQ